MEHKNIETWKSVGDFISGYECYYVSDFGRVKKIYKHGLEKIIKQEITKKGYLRVGFRLNKKLKHFLVHRLVGLAFIPNPNNYPIINHKDETTFNNFPENLEWCTHKYNSNYGTLNKRLSDMCIGENNHEYGKKKTKEQKERISKALKNNTKISKRVKQLNETGDIVNIWDSIREAERNGFSASPICLCCQGKQKTHSGFRWEYQK